MGPMRCEDHHAGLAVPSEDELDEELVLSVVELALFLGCEPGVQRREGRGEVVVKKADEVELPFYIAARVPPLELLRIGLEYAAFLVRGITGVKNG